MSVCIFFLLTSFILLVLNYRYDAFGSKISVNLVGPFKHTNISHDIITIDVNVGNGIRATKYFDIERSGDDQSKPDIVTFDMDIGVVQRQLNLSLHIETSGTEDALSLQLFVDTHALNTQLGAICGGIILIALNVLIISEVRNGIIAQKRQIFS